MPASAAIIGRVAVKVMPDTSDFRKDAERKLSAIEKSLRITIPTKLDMTGASREFLEELRKINQRNRTSDARKIRFHTTISRDGMRDEIVKARRHLENLALNEKIKFKVSDLDVTGTGRLEVDRQSLDDAKDQLEKWRERVSPLKVYVTPEVSAGAAAIATTRLAYLSRPRTVPLIPVVDNKGLAAAATALAALSGARVLHKHFDRITDSLKNLDKNVPIIGSLALATAGLAGWSAAAVSNLFALSASLAQIGPAALALPGILGGIAIGVGVMVAALKDFHTVFPDVKDAFSDMQKLISKNFWDGAKKSMREMLDVLLPQLSEGFGKTATALGGYFAGIADGIRGTLSKALGGMFDDLSESIKIATGGTGALVGIITTLGQVGAGYLPRLAQWFVDISEQFNKWLSAAAADGRLKQWIDTALVNLQALGSSLASIGGIFMSIGNAALAAGGSGLTVFADTLNRIEAVVKGDTFQNALTGVFYAAHAAMGQIATLSGPALSGMFEELAYTLTKILPLASAAIGTLVREVATALSTPAMQGALVGMFESLKTAVIALSPAIGPVGEALAALMPIVGALAEKLGPILAAAFTALSQVVVDLSPHIVKLIDFLGTQLLKAVETLAPAITALSGFLAEHETVAKVLAGVITGTVVTAYVAMAAQAVKTAATKVITWLTMTSAANAGAAGHSRSVAQIVAGWVLMAAKALLHGLAVAAVWTVQIVAKAVWATAQVAAQIAVQVAKWTWMAATAVAKGAVIATVWTAQIVAKAVMATAAVAAQIAIQVAKWVWMGAQALAAGARVAAAWLLALGPIGIIIAAVAAAALLIVRHWDTIRDAFNRGITAIQNAFNGARNWLVNAGQQIIDGLISGITAGFRRVQDALGRLTDMLPSWKGPAKRDKVLLTDAGKLVIDGFINGLESRYGAVRKSLQGLTRDVASTQFSVPQAAFAGPGGAAHGLASKVADHSTAGGSITKVLNYYAAPGSSVSSEEDLFAATSRARSGW